MIKLIATDMDGTFLNSKKQFDLSFIKTFEKMKKNNIRFVIASGNQYHRLFQKFIPLSTEMIFIAENGSYIADGVKELYSNTIKLDSLKQIVSLFENRTEIFIILCGKKAAYVMNVNKEYEDVVKTYYCSYQFVDSFEEVYDKDQIMKVAVYNPKEDITICLNQIKDQLPEEIKVVTSGNMWMDIQNKSINKGIAIKKIQELYNITFDECMAFGDQMNDFELLKSVKYAYAMDNAVEPIKEIAYAICKDNENQGVIKTIDAYLESL